jgi:predicted nuclease with RNAse H fold
MIMISPTNLSIGIDIQLARGCPYAILDERGEPAAAGWLPGQDVEAAVKSLDRAIEQLAAGRGTQVAIGIDAPRCFLPAPRQWYWDRDHWRPATGRDRGAGRHCEVVIAALQLARPQWTPLETHAPCWMRLGVALFEALGSRYAVYETFPSASYYQLKDDRNLRIGVRLGDFYGGPKDMLDAYVAAATVREYTRGAGCAVGGGDGLGTIILPRPVASTSAVLHWPDP